MTKPTHGGHRPGAGRPKSGRKQVTLQLSEETLDRLEAAAPTRIEQAAIIDRLVASEEMRQVRKKI